ncbi:sterile alpha motif domain-containing protein 11-like, partial [Protobothrops mucrosquamatus]|uniref:sterile alpha motif domain-containing protein 11-like n=1 Tax=Protobothrops mucrosquamatus TaxID=103944 RepID=UPI000775D1CF
MKRSQNSDLTSFLCNLHQSRQLGMPETQNRCEFKRSNLEVGLGAADEVLGKRKVCVSGSNGDCLLESKKSRSESPKENSHTPLLEGPVTQMTPEEDYRRLMSALNEHSTFEEQQQQRLYQLAGGISVPSHSDILRARQEVASRNPSSIEPHLSSASNSSSQRRKQGLPQHRDSHFTERLEMSAEIIRQKELENLHRQRLLATDPMGLHPGLPPDHPALRSLHDIPEGHPLRDELSRRNAMLVLRHNNAPLLSLNPQGVPTASTTPPKEQSTRRGTRKAAHSRCEALGQSEPKDLLDSRPLDSNHEEMKDSDSEAEANDEKPDALKAENSGGAGEVKECKEVAKTGEGTKELGEVPAGQNTPCSSSSVELPSYLLGPTMGKSEVKLLPTASLPPPQPLPFGFPYTMSPYFHA